MSNPFPGLRSFEEHEDHLFFGRDQDLDELLRRLRTTRFLAVLGTSGCGKSSLVKSGLIPSLYSGFMSGAGSGWHVALLRPGDDPIGGLAAALGAPGVLAGEDDELADMNRGFLESSLRRGDLGLVECVDSARLAERHRVLVVVDQFEELFRFKRQARGSLDDAVAFVQLLLAAAQQQTVPIYVVLTMRSDFIGRCTELPGLARAINRGQYLVPLMDREQRRAAITCPVAVGGGEISPRLVLRLLNDVGDDPDQLPILQHALMRTWDRWEQDHQDGEPLDLRHYQAVGTLEHALDRHAEEALAELGSESRRSACERLFKCLTERDPDSRQGVRRPSRLDEIGEVSGAGEGELSAVVEVFRKPGRSFLMPPAGTDLDAHSVIDISHESLMRVWKRLIGWVDEETEAASFYLRVAEAARRHEEGTAALWRDPELELGLRWREKHRPTAAWAERYEPGFERASAFLEASRKEAERELAARDHERRAKLRRARTLAAVLGSAALVTLALGVFAFHQRDLAADARDSALAAEEQAKLERDRAVAAEDQAKQERDRAVTAEEEARKERDRAVTAEENAQSERDRAVTAETVAASERDRAVKAEGEATSERDRAMTAEETAEAERDRARAAEVDAEKERDEARRLRRIAEARALAVQTLALQGDAQSQLAALLARQAWELNRASEGEAEDPEIYDALRLTANRLGGRAEELLGHRGAVRSLAVAPDGHTVASGGEDGEIRLSDLRRPQDGTKPAGSFDSGIRALAWSPDGRLVAGAADGSLRLFESARIEEAPRLLAPAAVPAADGTIASAVAAVAFQPGGALLAAAGADGRVRLWDLKAGAASTELGDGSAAIRALAWSPDGATLSTAGDGGVELWEVARPGAPPRVLSSASDVLSVAMSPDGGRLAAGRSGGTILLFDLGSGSGPIELAGHTASVSALQFHPRRPLLASASFDSTLRLWDAERPDALPLVLEGHAFWVYSARFSPDGEVLLSGSGDRTLRLWTTSSGVLAEEICGAVERNLSDREWAEYLPPDLPYEKTCPGLPEGAP